MKIKLKESISGLEFSYKPGDEVTIDDAEGTRWVNAGIAEVIEPAAAPESPETVEPTSTGEENATAGAETSAETVETADQAAPEVAAEAKPAAKKTKAAKAK
jgi:hypothetical protein